MEPRKTGGAADGRACLTAVAESGQERAAWARAHHVNARSLNAWRLNLARAHGGRSRPLRLVELVADDPPAATPYRADVFNGDHIAVYQFALTKHGDELAALLKGFQGVVMCDAERRLNELCRQEGIRRANCNAQPAGRSVTPRPNSPSSPVRPVPS